VSSSKRNRSRGPKPSRAERAPRRDDAEAAELQRLRGQAQADKALLDRLLAAESSPGAAALAGQVKARYEQALQRTCEVLGEALGDAEGRARELEEENRALRETNERLKYKTDKLNLELRRALGVSATTRDECGGREASAARPKAIAAEPAACRRRSTPNSS